MNKKIKLMLIIIISMSILTGCSDVLTDYIQLTLASDLSDRIAVNMDTANKLKNAGLITQDVYNDIISDLNKTKEKYADRFDVGDSTALASLKRLAKSNVSGLGLLGNNGPNIIYDDDGDELVMPDGGWRYSTMVDYIISNYLVYDIGVMSRPSSFKGSHSKFNSKSYLDDLTSQQDIRGYGDKDKGKAGWVYNTEAVPLTLFNNADLQKSINDKFRYDVYVLSGDALLDQQGVKSLDQIINIIKSNIDSEGNIIDAGHFNNYFEKTGEKLFDEEVKVIADSKLNDDSSKNKPGLDLVVQQYGKDVLAMRLHEFNIEAIDLLDDIIGLNQDKYLFYEDGSDTRVYVLEYPIHYLKTMRYENGDVTGEFERSELGINLRSGNLIKYNRDDTTGELLSSGEVITNADSELFGTYLPISGADGIADTGRSSFIIDGTTTIEMPSAIKLDGTAGGIREIECGRIILRDYLEATYAPDYMGGSEDMAVFGRKLRLNNMTFDSNGIATFANKDNIASFVDKDGKLIADASKLKYTDFIEISDRYGVHDKSDRGKVKYHLRRLPTAGETPVEKVRDATDVPSDKVIKVDDLSIVVDSEINPTTIFPGPHIGKVDYNGTYRNNQVFYAIGTNSDFFNTGLYDTWISSTSDTASLTWWSKWLSENNYTYSITPKKLEDYLVTNFKYEMTQEGFVILDLETIAKIQEEFNEQDTIARNRKVRNLFKISGWVIVLYSIIMMLAWVIDTNLDIGIDLLNKLTFGKWVATRYEEDIPTTSTDGTQYVTLRLMVVKSLIIATVGVIIMTVDVFRLVIALVKIIGELSSKISDIFVG